MSLDLFEKFQTLFVGVLGFTGVIITMIVNAKTQRDLQHDRRRDDAQSLRAALLVELKSNAQAYESRINGFSEQNGTRAALIPSKVADKIYQSSLPHIGLLSSHEVELVLRAYLLLEEMPYRLRILVGTENVGGYKDEFIKVDANKREAAKTIHEALLPSLLNAVSALEKNA